jgi:hypothetical protein
MRGTRAGHLTLICLLAVAIVAPPAEGPAGPPRAGAYLWQRAWTQELAAAVTRNADLITHWHVLVAEGPATGSLRAVAPNWTAILATGRNTTPVIRIDGQIAPDSAASLAAEMLALLQTLPPAAQTSLEIDHDCATSRLANYAAFLRLLRRRLAPGTALAITALPTWLSSPDLPDLARAAGHLILQVHAVDDPRVDLFDARHAEAWVRRMEQVSPRTFEISLPAYSVRIVTGPSGGLLAASGENASHAPGPGEEDIAPPAEVARFLAWLRSENPPLLTGIVWFRLPLASDRRAWSAATLRRLTLGQAPAEHLVTEANAGVLSLRNDGDDVPLPARITFPRGCVGDGLGSYGSDGSVLVRDRNGLLRSGERLVVGWFRCGK